MCFNRWNAFPFLELTFPSLISRERAGYPLGSETLSKTPVFSEVRNSNCNSNCEPTWNFSSGIRKRTPRIHF
jgi:hypothetical protein